MGRCADEQKEINADGTNIVLLYSLADRRKLRLHFHNDAHFATPIQEHPSVGMVFLMRISTFCETSRVWVCDDIHVLNTIWVYIARKSFRMVLTQILSRIYNDLVTWDTFEISIFDGHYNFDTHG